MAARTMAFLGVGLSACATPEHELELRGGFGEESASTGGSDTDDGCRDVPGPPAPLFPDVVFLAGDDRVVAYDASTGSWLADFWMGGDAIVEIERGLGNQRVWAVDAGGHFAAIDPWRRAIAVSQGVGPSTFEVDMTVNANRQAAYVTYPNQLPWIQSARGAGPMGAAPFGPADLIAASPTDDAVFASVGQDLVEWDTSTGAVSQVWSTSLPKLRAAVSRDGDRVFVATHAAALSNDYVESYDRATRLVDPASTIGLDVRNIAPDVDGFRVAVADDRNYGAFDFSIVGNPTWTIHATLVFPVDVAVSDAGHVYVLVNAGGKHAIERYDGGNLVSRICLDERFAGLEVITPRAAPTVLDPDTRERWVALIRSEPIAGWDLPFSSKNLSTECPGCDERDIDDAASEAMAEFPPGAELQMRDVAKFLRAGSPESADVEDFLDEVLVPLADE